GILELVQSPGVHHAKYAVPHIEIGLPKRYSVDTYGHADNAIARDFELLFNAASNIRINAYNLVRQSDRNFLIRSMEKPVLFN
ncbi:hypothetical protein M2C68_21055, partial [Pseudomonas sp. BAgro211]|nr:hypothetical protein [Pseudomonas sp. BAgro211]